LKHAHEVQEFSSKIFIAKYEHGMTVNCTEKNHLAMIVVDPKMGPKIDSKSPKIQSKSDKV
jgi:hypothetical protein